MTGSTGQIIGITSTIPSEIVYAAGCRPLDLNNAFINAEDPYALVGAAEADGFPRNYCAWMKGIYGVLKANPDIRRVIGVLQGDCSNTAALLDLLSHRGYDVVTFAYPVNGEPETLAAEIAKLARVMRTDIDASTAIKTDLDSIRAIALAIDEMTWQDNVVTGLENHRSLITASDFGGEPSRYRAELVSFKKDLDKRQPFSETVRLGFAGVPLIVDDLYEVVEELDGRVVYNEVQREFAMPHSSLDLVEQYSSYTYPYGARRRAEEIKIQAGKRSLHGLIHYVQSFCYHQLDDIVIREVVGIPTLTLEADKPGPLDSRSRLRLEAFIETLGG